MSDAAAIVQKRGEEAVPVPGRILWPIIHALRAIWAALLANVADDSTAPDILPGFVDILASLSAIEVQLLDWIYECP